MEELDFEQIYERYHQPLYRFCLSIIGNPEDARDALQNTMVKALRALPGEKREIQLKPWLYRVAHNESIELLRQRRDQVELDERLAASSTAEPGEAAAVRERLRTLLADLRELPERQRAALVMRELAGLEFAEIAEALETSPSVARQTVYEARLSLGQLEAGREMGCEEVRWELSGEDGRVRRRRDIQAHLRGCAECRAFGDAIANRRRDFAAFAPLPATASAGVLHAVLAGGKSGSGVLAGTVGAGKVAAGSAALKTAATVAVVAAIAVPAADRGGLVDVGLFHDASHSQGSGQTSAAPGAAGAGAAGVKSSAGLPGAADSQAAGLQGSAHAQGGLSATGETAGENAPTTSGNGHSPADESSGSRESGELPAASSHGQETAASHGGGRASAGSRKGEAHDHAPGQPAVHKPSHPAPPRHGRPPEKAPSEHPPVVQPPNVAPDNPPEAPLQPSEPPTAKGPPEESGGQRSKEAR